jgi:hypothetical protein
VFQRSSIRVFETYLRALKFEGSKFFSFIFSFGCSMFYGVKVLKVSDLILPDIFHWKFFGSSPLKVLNPIQKRFKVQKSNISKVST